MTALAYNRAATGRDITKIDDLWDPAFKGKVSLLADTQDGLGMIMLSQGSSVENPTSDGVNKAVELIKKQKDAGQIRRFTGNDYADDLASGNVVIAQAYSGDVVQLQKDNPDLKFVVPDTGGTTFVDTMVIPPYTTQNQKAAEAWINYVYDRANYAKLIAHTQYVPVLSDMTDELNKIDPGLAANPLINPPKALSTSSRRGRRSPTSRPTSSTRPTPPSPASNDMAGVASSNRQRSKLAPYLMILPALAYLGVFYVIPFFSLLRTSLSTMGGSIYLPKLTFAWEFGNYGGDALSQYREQILRSFGYALTATVLCLLLAFPLAYVIAFKAGGRYKNLLLGGLVILPFFVTFLIRTLAWKTILADDGWVVHTLGTIGLLPSEGGRLLSTGWAVIGGLTYNWIIFMILPLYVSLEKKIDGRLLEASRDLYASNRRMFGKVIMPLAMPGVLAGSMLVFIPSVGDFINADYLGSTQTRMIGNVIQKQFLVVKDYPAAAALSFVLMALILVGGVLIYTRALGTEDLV